MFRPPGLIEGANKGPDKYIRGSRSHALGYHCRGRRWQHQKTPNSQDAVPRRIAPVPDLRTSQFALGYLAIKSYVTMNIVLPTARGSRCLFCNHTHNVLYEKGRL
jgi:hypothetical protein